jgi:hypothetical protein
MGISFAVMIVLISAALPRGVHDIGDAPGDGADRNR